MNFYNQRKERELSKELVVFKNQQFYFFTEADDAKLILGNFWGKPQLWTNSFPLNLSKLENVN